MRSGRGSEEGVGWSVAGVADMFRRGFLCYMAWLDRFACIM